MRDDPGQQGETCPRRKTTRSRNLSASSRNCGRSSTRRWPERPRWQRELATRTAELPQRNTEYGERIEHQAATIDVLKVMSASPGDPQPVFDLIVTRARDLCDAYGVTVYEFDGTLIHWRAATGVSDDPSVRQAVEAMYPMAPTREWAVGRAIMDRQIIRIDDMETEPGLNPATAGDHGKVAGRGPVDAR